MIYEPRSSHPLRDPQHPQAQRKPGTTLPVATSASSSTGRSIAGRLLAAMGAALIVIGSGAMLDPARAKVNENENQLAPRLEVPLLLPSADEVEVLPLAYVPALEHDLFTRGMGDDGWSVVTVRRNDNYGIYLHRSNLAVDQALVHDNGNVGVYIYSDNRDFGGNVTLDHGTIAHNAREGILAARGSSFSYAMVLNLRNSSVTNRSSST